MKKILSAVLLGTFVLASFPAHAQNGQEGFGEELRTKIKWAIRNLIPQKADTYINFSWSEPATVRGTKGRKDTLKNCQAIFCNYKEKNGLGTVDVAVNAECVKKAMEENPGRVRLHVSLAHFETRMQKTPWSPWSYETEIQSHTFKNIFHYRGIGAPIYILHVPVPSEQQTIKNGLKALFPNEKSFIPENRAVLVLSTYTNCMSASWWLTEEEVAAKTRASKKKPSR